MENFLQQMVLKDSSPLVAQYPYVNIFKVVKLATVAGFIVIILTYPHLHFLDLFISCDRFKNYHRTQYLGFPQSDSPFLTLTKTK